MSSPSVRDPWSCSVEDISSPERGGSSAVGRSMPGLNKDCDDHLSNDVSVTHLVKGQSTDLKPLESVGNVTMGHGVKDAPSEGEGKGGSWRIIQSNLPRIRSGILDPSFFIPFGSEDSGAQNRADPKQQEPSTEFSHLGPSAFQRSTHTGTNKNSSSNNTTRGSNSSRSSRDVEGTSGRGTSQTGSTVQLTSLSAEHPYIKRHSDRGVKRGRFHVITRHNDPGMGNPAYVQDEGLPRNGEHGLHGEVFPLEAVSLAVRDEADDAALPQDDARQPGCASLLGSVVSNHLRRLLAVRRWCCRSSCCGRCPLSCRKRWRKTFATELTKKQIAEKYRVHIFTMVVFVCACLFVGLGWYYKDLTRLVIMQSQKIFLDQGNRVLALAGDSYDIKYQMLVGRNLPPLQLPLHCPELDAGPSRECLWREEAVLRVRYERPTPGEGQSWDGVHCYRVSWQSLHHSTLPEDCFELQQESTQWYGPSNQSAGVFPVKGTFDFVSSPYHLGNAGVFSSAVELYWLSSKGVGILVNASDPVTVHWNSKVDNHVCVVSNYTGPLFGRSQRAGRLPTLNYTVCVGPNPVTTHLAMRAYARQPDDVTSGRRPSDVMFTYPQWSLSGLTSKADYNQSDVLHALEQLKNENMACDLLHLDGEWQRYQGDLTFDSLRFPELSRLADTVRNASCGLGIQLSPFFDYRADSSFYDGVVNSHFVKDAGGQVPGLVQVRQGAAAAAAMAVLDVSSANARVWFNIKVKALSGSLGGFPLLRSIGLSLGENGWLPYKPTLYDDNVTFWQLRRLMSEMAADLAVSFTLKASTASSSSSNTRTTFAITSSITGGGSGGSNSASISTSSKSEAGGLLLSHTAGSQTSPAFIAIVAEVVQTELAADGGGEAGTTLCLSGLVERALTLGLMGYAYVMADGVQLPAAPQPQPILQQPSLFPSLQTPVQGQTQGLSQSQSQSQAQAEDHSRELLLRWMQVAAFFPAARFNVGPWRHGNESVSMAANLSRLHKEVVLPILASKEMRNDVENKGLPILRPTWWLEPAASGQESLQQVLGTQFLLGNDLLVAPVLCVGQTRRSIYVPEGVWSDPLRGKMIEGPTLLKNYRVGLHEIPYFARAPLWEEEPADNH